MTDYKIVFEKNPSQAEIQILGDGIIQNAKDKKGQGPMLSFAFFVRDENDQIRGGCEGNALYGGSWVGSLWVEKSFVARVMARS